MNKQERLALSKMLKEGDVEETTQLIRELKHSNLIADDVNKMITLKKKYQRLDAAKLGNICMSQCKFIHQNYTDIYNKLFKDEINLTLLFKFLNVLKDIEDEKMDQHEGSFLVGKILKEIYIDSVLKQEEHDKTILSKKDRKKGSKPKKKITWAEWKASQELIE
jgi:hypothetical protein